MVPAMSWLCRQPARPAINGFTLIELMIVIAMLAILATLVVPGMASFVASRRVEDVARRLADDLALARNESVKRNSAVLVCADAAITGATCAATPAATDWKKGWRICFDVDGDGACDVGSSADPNPVRVQGAVSDAVTLSGPASRIRFNPNGSLSASAFTDFDVKSVRAAPSKWLVKFAASGAMSVRKVATT